MPFTKEHKSRRQQLQTPTSATYASDKPCLQIAVVEESVRLVHAIEEIE